MVGVQWSAAQGVGEGAAVGVDDGGWSEFDASSVDGDVPAGVMHLAVVCFTEQDAVFYAGVAAVDPVLAVVCVAQSWWSVAAGERASAVPRDEGAADGEWDGSQGPSDVEGFGGPAQHDGDD
jgi:hypothetical protein